MGLMQRFNSSPFGVSFDLWLLNLHRFCIYLLVSMFICAVWIVSFVISTSYLCNILLIFILFHVPIIETGIRTSVALVDPGL